MLRFKQLLLPPKSRGWGLSRAQTPVLGAIPALPSASPACTAACLKFCSSPASLHSSAAAYCYLISASQWNWIVPIKISFCFSMWYAKHVCRQNFHPFLHLPFHCAPQQSHGQSQCFFIPLSSWILKCLLPGPHCKLTECGCYISVPLAPLAQIPFWNMCTMWRRKGLRVGGFPTAAPTLALLRSPIHVTKPLQKPKRGKKQTSEHELLG